MARKCCNQKKKFFVRVRIWHRPRTQNDSANETSRAVRMHSPRRSQGGDARSRIAGVSLFLFIVVLIIVFLVVEVFIVEVLVVEVFIVEVLVVLEIFIVL